MPINDSFIEKINDSTDRVLPLHYKDVKIQTKDTKEYPSKIVRVIQYQTEYYEVYSFYKPISKFI